jgi:hypothetical protein
MATVKDKMIEELAIYVASVRDGEDAMLDDETIAEKAFDRLATAASDNMEGGDYGVLSDLLLMEVEEFVTVEDTWGVRGLDALLATAKKQELTDAVEALLNIVKSL